MKKIYTLVMLMISLVLVASAQNITGKVTDEKGVSIPGVTILWVGTTSGTLTDIDGNYSIKAMTGTLRFSYIGYVTQEIAITNQKILNVSLVPAVTSLDEVVVIGYGTQKKKDISTAVVTVGEKEIKDRPIVTAAQAIQGKAAGVLVTQTSGKPGANLAIRVRGTTSVMGGNEPLFVVDGIPTTDIANINANDIESMTILKDASAAAIYGSNSANGIVLITTKSGSSGNQSVKFNTFFGVSQIRRTIDVLNTKQYRELLNDIGIPYDNSWTNYTNWNDEVFKTGYTQSYQFSTSGGNDKSTYFSSIGYLSENGIIHPSRFDRISAVLNLNNNLLPWLKFGTNINIAHNNFKDTPDNLSSGRGGVVMAALNTPPFLSVYKADGSGWFDPNPIQNSWENPVAYMIGADRNANTDRIIGSLSLEASLTKDIHFKSRLGTDVNFFHSTYYQDPFRTSYGRTNHGVGSDDKTELLIYTFENTLDYIKVINKHQITALIGQSLQNKDWSRSYLWGTNFPDDVSVKTLHAANTITGDTYGSSSSLSSFFGRVMYNYAGKYYLTSSVREDGSSKLTHKWGTLPSFSAAWRISSENFMSNINFIDDLKLRFGWGRTGNDKGLDDYIQYGLVEYYRFIPDPKDPLTGPASQQISYSNPDLKWETTDQTNVGFDLTMLRDKITVVFDIYRKYTRDLIMDVQLPSYMNVTHIQTNVGEISNKGIEFTISSVNCDKKDFRWNSDFNMSFNKQKVEKLDYTPVYFFGHIYSNNSNVSIIKAGLPVGSFYGYIADGVDPETGKMIYQDLSGNGSIGPEDRTVIGCAQPDFFFGLTNHLTYKKFDLDVFIQGTYGNDIYNATRIDLEGMFDSKNQSVAVLDRWTPDNTVTDIPKAGSMYNVFNSSRFIEDGSYVRLKSVTLSYKILQNNSKTRIKNLSVYMTGQNLFTLTNYSGYDPEVSSYGQNSAEMGIDYGTYPQYRTVLLGLNVEF